jgi:Flp pilus assembly protein TadG
MCGFDTRAEKDKEHIAFGQTHIRHCGMAYIWTVFLLLIFILLAGMGFDAARVYVAAHQLQNAADAAALAGARVVKTSSQDDARQQAMDIASLNSVLGQPVLLNANTDNYDPNNGDIIIGIYNRSSKTFTPTTTDPNAVKVIAKRTADSLNGSLSLIFARIINVNTIDISRDAIAIVELFGDGLITLEDDCSKPGLDFSGASGELTVNNGNIQINSYADNSGKAQPDVNANAINIACSTAAGFLPPDITQYNQPTHPDPLASIQPPPIGPDLSPTHTETHGQNTVTVVDPVTTGTFSEGGYFSGGINGAGLDSLILNDGVYIVDGVGLKGNFTANNAMIYIKGPNPDGTGGTGQIDLIGNESITITPMTSGEYRGIAIYQDRANSNTPSNGINGSDGLNIQGTIYLPAVDLLLTGTPGTFGNQIIVNTLQIKGRVNINVNYTGAYGVYRSFLVK